jgi:hypothetical protein
MAAPLCRLLIAEFADLSPLEMMATVQLESLGCHANHGENFGFWRVGDRGGGASFASSASKAQIFWFFAHCPFPNQKKMEPYSIWTHRSVVSLGSITSQYMSKEQGKMKQNIPIARNRVKKKRLTWNKFHSLRPPHSVCLSYPYRCAKRVSREHDME